MRPAVSVSAVACLLLAPPGAGAATRYVTPDGLDGGACSRSAPCSLGWALEGDGSRAGDEVVVGGGTYVDQPVVIRRPLTVTARPDAPRPVLRLTRPGGVALTVGADALDTVVEHLDVRAAGAGATAVEVLTAATLDDVVLRAADGACLRSAASGLRLEDAVLRQAGAGSVPCLQTTGEDTTWQGVTVAAPAADVAAVYRGNATITDATITGRLRGLELSGEADAHRLTVSGRRAGLVLGGSTTVTDSVAVVRRTGAAVRAAGGAHLLLNLTAYGRGAGSTGILADDGAELTVKNTIARGRAIDLDAGAGRILVESSNWRGGGGTIVDEGANQSAPPRFVAPAAGDFRLRAGSPAVDAGSFELNSGGADRDGRFRWLGPRPDIGAYERPAPRPGRRPDTRRPTLGVVRLGRSAFRARGAGAGTRLLVVVSETSDLVLQVWRPHARRSSGTIVVPLRTGTNRVRLTARVDGRPLRPGRYVMTVTARDVAQNLSRPRRLAFRVLR